jgi:hypothetical protein
MRLWRLDWEKELGQVLESQQSKVIGRINDKKIVSALRSVASV